MASQQETIQFRPRGAKTASGESRRPASGGERRRRDVGSVGDKRQEYGVRPAITEQKAKGAKSLPIPEIPKISLPSSPVARRAVIILGILAITLVFLYGPTRAYYSAVRDEQVYSAQLEELNETNEELRRDVDRLQSREGIEDEARKRGYVAQGEVPVVVEGLEVDDRGTADAGASAAQTREDDDPWYVELLDFVFGYEPPEFVAK